jgi:hypothetical protein
MRGWYNKVRRKENLAMKRFKGTVKNHMVVLDERIHLPEGTQVEVRLRPCRKKDRQEAFERIRRNPITHYVGIDEVIEEDKKERDARWEHGT